MRKLRTMNTMDVKSILSDIKRTSKVPNNIVYIFLGALLFIDFLPHSKAIDPLYPQYLYLSLLNIAMGIYFYFNPVVISIDTFPLLKKSYLLRAYFVFIIFCGISAFSAKNGTLILEKIAELIVAFCLIINFVILLKNRLDLLHQIIFIICIDAFLQCGVELYNLKQLAAQSSLASALPLMVKTTGNINILASSLTTKIPFLLLAVINFSGLKKWFSYIALLLVTITVLLTSARAIFISMSLICLLYTSPSPRDRQKSRMPSSA